MRRLIRTMKVLFFSGICVAVGVAQAVLIESPRPRRSRVHWMGGMPCLEALCAFGLLTLSVIDLMNNAALSYLTYRRRGAGDGGIYTSAEMERLGNVHMSTSHFFTKFVLVLTIWVPVPMARVMLGDATYTQAVLGCLQGAFLGIVYHVCFVTMCGRGGRRMQLVQQRLIIPVLQWRRLLACCCCWTRELRELESRVPFSRQGTAFSEQEDTWREKLEALHAEHRSNIRQENDRYEELLADTWNTIPDQLARSKKLSKPALVELREAERSALSLVPGLEFLSIQSDAFLHLFAQKEEELENAKEARDILTEQLQERNEDLMNQQIELEEQGMMMQLQRQMSEKAQSEIKETTAQEVDRLRRQMCEEQDAARRQHAAELEAMKRESERMKAQQTAELERSLRQTTEHYSKAMQQAEKDFEEAKRRADDSLEEQKKKQGRFVQNLVTFAQALTKMLDAVKEGDRKALEVEYKRVRQLRDGMEEESISQLAEPLLEQASQFMSQWHRRIQDLGDALCKAGAYKGTDPDKLSQCARQLFGTIVAAIDKGLNLSKHDKELCVEAEQWLCSRWLVSFAKNHMDPETGRDVVLLHNRIIHKAVWATKDEIGTFDFTDLEACLEHVDCAQRTFIESAKAQVDHNPPRNLERALSQLSTLIYFLNYLEREDLQKTKQVFATYLSQFGTKMGAQVQNWVRHVSARYNEDSTLLRQTDLKGIKSKKPADVIRTMASRRCPALGKLQDIFCRLANAWEADFKVLAVPHHTQVFTLLVFKAFMEDRQDAVRTLIAQVSTGEGKSMLIASLAVFVCLHSKKRVHVVGSDSKLVFRDFDNFRSMFHSFAQDVAPGMALEKFAVVCSDKTHDSNRTDVVSSIPHDAWIVYCEARHVTSYYTQQARSGSLDQINYAERVLVLDEVDALVIDEDPTEEFVYDVGWRRLDRGMTVGEYATQLGRHLARGDPCPDELRPVTDMEESVYWLMVRLFRDVEQWHSKPRAERDADFQVYAGDSRNEAQLEAGLTGLYVRMSNGRADLYYHSNFLECLRLREHPDATGYRMQWYQRLFVMCKPRVFRQYSRILGLSGTVGNEREQAFLREAYGAQFFMVPPFLETCTGVQFHTAQWAKSEEVFEQGELKSVSMHPGLSGPGAVACDAEEQYRIVETLAFETRRRVPVLVIAPSPESADLVVDRLRQHARKALVGCNPSDLVRSLSQREYDRDPHVYKESLRASTRTASRSSVGPKEFRITVTDHTGARGTDYQMFDEDADKVGGLMLIVMKVPPSQRDWVQFKGRTARQHWRGQYCVVLNAEDYRLPDGGAGGALPAQAYGATQGRPFVPHDPEGELVQKVLAFGTRESERKLDNCKAVYSAGFIANEVCEMVWEQMGRREALRRESGDLQRPRGLGVDVDLEGRGRRAFLELCARYRYMSADEIADVAGSIELSRSLGRLNFVLARDSKVPDKRYVKLPMPPGMSVHRQKAVLFLVDVSGSMTVNTIGPTLTRLDVCKTQVKHIMLNERILCDDDYLGIVAFGAGHRKIFPDPRAWAPWSSRVEIVGPVDRRAVKALVDNKELEAAQTGSLKEYGEELKPFESNPRVDLKNTRLGMYTFLYSTLHACANELVSAQCGPNSPGGDLSRWIILLCDGDDSGGGLTEERVRALLGAHGRALNLVIIAVGSDVKSGPVLQGFADTVRGRGGVGLYITATDEHDDTAIRNAFAQVEESLMLDGGGQTEAGGH